METIDNTEVQQKFVSIYDALIAKGELRGEKRGKEIGNSQRIEIVVLNSFKNNLDLPLIASIADISVQKVKDILRTRNLIQ